VKQVRVTPSRPGEVGQLDDGDVAGSQPTRAAMRHEYRRL
jgi:hypothetical protein